MPGIEEDPELDKKLESLKAREKKKEQQLETLQKSEAAQISRTDPDARLLKKQGK